MPSPIIDRVDGSTASVAFKAPCRVATTANLSLSGLPVVDGVQLVAGDRVLVKDQTSSVSNGIYVAASTAWARATDFDGNRDAARGTLVRVNEGTLGPGFWTLTTSNPVLIGTSNIVWSLIVNDLQGVSAYVLTLLDDVSAAAFRATLELAASLHLQDKQGADIATAANVNLNAATGDLVELTGNTTITAFTLAQGVERTCRLAGAPLITHGASLLCPGNVSIQGAAGDTFKVRGYAAGVTRIYGYQPFEQGVLSKLATAKGDTLSASAARTLLRRAAPANGSIFVADSAQASGWQGAPYLSTFSKHIEGLELANNVADATNDIDVATGAAMDSTGVSFMALTAALTKRLDASWVVGNNQGGLDGTESVTGTPDNDTWYYAWLIMRSDTGVVDVLFSESSTTPTMPTSYDRKRLIGAVRRGTAANLLFFQEGNHVNWRTPIAVLSGGTATSETSVTTTSAVPPIATSFDLKGQADQTHLNTSDAFNQVFIRIVSGTNYANIATTRSGSGNTTLQSIGAMLRVPRTGTLFYFNNVSTVTTHSSTLTVHGFWLAR